MKKTILSLFLLSQLLIAAPALSQDTEPTAPDAAPTAPVELRPAPVESTTKPLYKKVLHSCGRFAKGTGRRVKNATIHPVRTIKGTPAETVKVVKTCHAKALDFSDNHERDFRLIGNLTTLAGAVFFIKGIAQKWNPTSNKTVVIGQ